MCCYFNWIRNEFPKWIFVIFWLGGTLAGFGINFWIYYTEPRFFYVRKLIGLGLPIARGAAMALNINVMLILLPTCRNLITIIRGVLIKCRCCMWMARLLDRGLTFHRNCAFMICFFTAVHAIAHMYNVENSNDVQVMNHLIANKQLNYSSLSQSKKLLYTLSNLTHTPVIIKKSGTLLFQIATLECFLLLPGVSGVLMTASLVVMLASSLELDRKFFFNRFWLMHHLYIVFLGGFLIHGAQGVVKSQANVAAHNVTLCADKFESWRHNSTSCPTPIFRNGGAMSWKFVVIPISLYILERLIRFARSVKPVTLDKVIFHPSRVCELRMKRDGFKCRAGQYIFINCPNLSTWQWHPFTLTSTEYDDFFSVHIRSNGDWTDKLLKLLKSCSPGSDGTWPIRLCVDGPFGTASEHIYKFPVSVLIGSGIGVTPFAGILRSYWHRRKANIGDEARTSKVFFIWSCGDSQCFEWFGDMLRELETMVLAEDANFLTYKIFVTQGLDANKILDIVESGEQSKDIFTGLQQPTFFLRPNFETIFEEISKEFQNTKIGVFYCGVKPLSKKLHGLCKTTGSKQGNQFYYNKEVF